MYSESRGVRFVPSFDRAGGLILLLKWTVGGNEGASLDTGDLSSSSGVAGALGLP